MLDLWQLHVAFVCLNSESVSCFSKVFRRCKASGAMLDIVDACSMLYRLEMEGKIWT